MKKGTRTEIDSYSAFFDNNKGHQTELDDLLKQRHIDAVYCVGLATDYCVAYTAQDARDLGFDTYVVTDGCAGITAQGSQDALDNLKRNGINIIESSDLLV